MTNTQYGIQKKLNNLIYSFYKYNEMIDDSSIEHFANAYNLFNSRLLTQIEREVLNQRDNNKL